MRSRFLSRYLAEYFQTYHPETTPVSPKDPRSKSRALLQADSLKDKGFGALSRILNEFPLHDETLPSPVDEFAVKDLCREFDLLLIQEKFEVDYQVGGLKPMSSLTQQKMKNFLAYLIAVTCPEVINEKGELLPGIVKSLNLEELIKANASNPEELRNIAANVLLSYCNQIVFGAITEVWDRDYAAYRSQNVPIGLVTLAMVKIFDLDEAFLKDQIENYRYRAQPLFQHCAKELTTVAREQFAEFREQEIEGSPKFLKQMRIKFWFDVMRASSLESPTRIDKLPTQKVEKWLQARDNTFIVDELHRQLSAASGVSQSERSFIRKLVASKLDREKIQRPTVDFIKSALSTCPTTGVLYKGLSVYARQLGISVATPLVQNSVIQAPVAKPQKLDVVERVLFRCF